jgi:hypothetical protein
VKCGTYEGECDVARTVVRQLVVALGRFEGNFRLVIPVGMAL